MGRRHRSLEEGGWAAGKSGESEGRPGKEGGKQRIKGARGTRVRPQLLPDGSFPRVQSLDTALVSSQFSPCPAHSWGSSLLQGYLQSQGTSAQCGSAIWEPASPDPGQACGLL